MANQKRSAFGKGLKRVSGLLSLAIFVSAILHWATAGEPTAEEKETATLVETVVKRSPYGPPASAKEPKLTDEQIARVAEHLRKQYPYRSLRERLEYEKKLPQDRPAPALTKESGARLAKDDLRGKRSYDPRTRSLEQLHSTNVRTFITQEGAGLMRMRAPGPDLLALPDVKPIPLAPPAPSAGRDEDPLAELPLRDPTADELLGKEENLPPSSNTAEALEQHRIAYRNRLEAGLQRWEATHNPLKLPSAAVLTETNTQLGFAFAGSWRNGHIKSLDQVAGFEPHSLASMPSVEPWRDNLAADKRLWQVGRMELVSLLKHEKPAVYVSKNLPRMEELKGVKTRTLDAFEEPALKKLREGEDVVIESHTNRIVMLGAVRASNQCLQCHDVKHGELLGAFSYELLRREPIAPPPKEPAENKKPTGDLSFVR